MNTKVLLVLIGLLFLTVRSQDEDLITISGNEEDEFHSDAHISSVSNTTVSDELLDDDGYVVDDNQKEILNHTVIEAPKKQENLPEAKVILPIRRRDTAQSEMNVAPCGGVAKRKSDTLTNKGSNIHVIWEIVNPVAQGNCTVKLSQGLDRQDTFTPLRPVDVTLDKNGQFPCGRVKGFDSHEFALPEDYVCDQCTLQWTWMTPLGNFYSCSDIIINGNQIEDCLAMCKNQGACFNGKCICAEGFYGEFCQHNVNESSGFGWILLIIILLAIVGGAVYWFSQKNNNINPSLLNPRSNNNIKNPFINDNQQPKELTS